MTAKTTLQSIQRWVWICIYSGLLSIVLSIFLARQDLSLARVIQWAGFALVSVGVVLIYVRSRLSETPSNAQEPGA